jgi:hypothetical protein
MHGREVGRPVGQGPADQGHVQEVALPAIERTRPDDSDAGKGGAYGIFTFGLGTEELRRRVMVGVDVGDVDEAGDARGVGNLGDTTRDVDIDVAVAPVAAPLISEVRGSSSDGRTESDTPSLCNCRPCQSVARILRSGGRAVR